jgi:hypothetical protein
MTEVRKRQIADIAMSKNMDYETLKDSDYMYDEMDTIDDVWAYVNECHEIGTKAYYVKYKEANE